MAKLPTGFVLDEPAQQGTGLPEGFVLDEPQTGFDPSAFGQDYQAARTAIEQLPEDQRQAAIDAYAKQYVMQERAGGGLGQTLTDYARMAARNVPYVGEFADELNAATAALFGGDYEMAHAAEQERRRQIDAQQRPGVETPLGRVDLGDVAKATGVGAGIFAAPMAAPFQAAKVGTGMASGLNAALNAAAMTAADVAGRSEGDVGERVVEGVTAGAKAAPFGFVGGAVGQKILDRAIRGTPIFGKGRGSEEIKAAASDLYDKADQAGIIFSDKLGKRLAREVQADMADFGYHPALQPQIQVALREIDRLAQGNVTLKGMDTLRKVVNNIRTVPDRSTAKAAGKIVDRIDDALLNTKPGEVLGGNVARGVKALNDARKGWREFRKVELVEEAMQRADDAALQSGKIGQAQRTQLQRLLRNKRTSRAFTPAERDQIRRTIRGSTIGGAAERFGKMSPLAGGLNPLAYGAVTAATPGGFMATVPLALATEVSRLVGKRMSQRGVDRLVEKLSGGQLGTRFNAWQRAVKAGGTPARQTAATNAMARYLAEEVPGLSVRDATDALFSMLEQSIDIPPQGQ